MVMKQIIKANGQFFEIQDKFDDEELEVIKIYLEKLFTPAYHADVLHCRQGPIILVPINKSSSLGPFYLGLGQLAVDAIEIKTAICEWIKITTNQEGMLRQEIHSLEQDKSKLIRKNMELKHELADSITECGKLENKVAELEKQKMGGKR
jgi:hypothetical protein